MGRDGSATRERLVDAAEHVFASLGIEDANLREINRAAGQSNNSALHYHFGSREALLQAVVRRHRDAIDSRRRVLVEELGGKEPSIEELLVVAVWPLGFQLDTESGRNYLRTLVHMRRRSEMRTHHSLNPDSTDDLQWAYSQLQARLVHLPDALRAERLGVWIDMAVGAMASRAEDIQDGVDHSLDNNEFMNNLIDMGVAALTAPSRLTTARPAGSGG